MSQPGREGAPCAQPGAARRLSPPALCRLLSAFVFHMQETCPSQSRPLGRGKWRRGLGQRIYTHRLVPVQSRAPIPIWKGVRVE